MHGGSLASCCRGSLHLQVERLRCCRLALQGWERVAVLCWCCSGPRWLTMRTTGENHVNFGLRKWRFLKRKGKNWTPCMCLKLWENFILFSHMCFLSSEKAIFVGLLSKQMNIVGRSSQGCSQCGQAPRPHSVSPLMDIGAGGRLTQVLSP